MSGCPLWIYSSVACSLEKHRVISTAPRTYSYATMLMCHNVVRATAAFTTTASLSTVRRRPKPATCLDPQSDVFTKTGS